MADLTDLQRAETVKIVGSDSSGLETNAVNATVTGSLFANLRDSSGTESGTETNPLITIAADLLSTLNSTSSNLASGETFTGTGEDTLDYGIICVSIYSNVSGSFYMQWSRDNVTFYNDGDVYDITAGVLKKTTYGPGARYFRIVFTNGATPTTTFFIQTILKSNYTKPSTHKISEALNDNSDSELVKAIISGKRNDGFYGNARLTNGNNLVTAVGEFDTSLLSSGDLAVADIVDTTATTGAITVGTTAVAARVGGANLTNRKSLVIYNNSSSVIYWGPSGVSTTSGMPIFPGDEKSIRIGANITVFLIAGTTNLNVRVAEMS